MSAAERERVIWQSFPSWSQFSWLYFLTFLSAFRGLIFLHLGLPGWQVWMVGAFLLLLVVAIIRRWEVYAVTSERVVIRNGYTRRDIAWVKKDEIQNIDVMQGPIARLWGIGTLRVQSTSNKCELRLRGIKTPEVVEAKIRAMWPNTL